VRLGLAHAARSRGDFADAERRYRELSTGEGDVAAESLYWAGVSRYKSTNDASALGETANAFATRFPESAWAKKASVWTA
jgi:TolA-binding protein